jgi:hypothetical protein
MLRIGKDKSSNSNIVLPAITSIPNMDDLKFLLSKAQKNWRISAELPFRVSEHGSAYVAEVRCSSDGTQTFWSLYKQNDNESQMLWNHPSQDVFLIFNLIHSECMSEEGSSQLPPDAGIVDKEASIMRKRVGEDQEGADQAGSDQAGSAAAGHLAETIGRVEGRAQPEIAFEGDIANQPLSNVLQSIVEKKLTGRLLVSQTGDGAEVYFSEGLPVHATCGRAIGNGALVELLSWEQGKYAFYNGEEPVHHTIQKPLEEMMAEGANLLEQGQYLQERNILSKSRLVRKQNDLSEAAVTEATTGGASVSPTLQWNLYLTINGNSTLEQILDNNPMSKAQWVPIVYNLVHFGLVDTADVQPAAHAAQVAVKRVQADKQSIESAIQALTNPETEIFSYAALLYFLEQERIRFGRGGMSYALLIFEVWLEDESCPGGLRQGTQDEAKEFCQRVKQAKRDLDFLAHGQDSDLALLLPHADRPGAETVAARLSNNLCTYPLSNGKRVHIFCGVANVPEDGRKTEEVLLKAREAKESAKASRKPVTGTADLLPPEEQSNWTL